MKNDNKRCHDCMFLFCDETVGFYECSECGNFTDEEYTVYEDLGFLPDCPYYRKDERWLIEPPSEE